MSTIKLNGTTSGSSIIKAPDSGSTNQTFTLPASSGTLVTTTDAGVAGITSSADATAITIGSDEKVTLSSTDSENLFIDGGHSTDASIKIKGAYHSNLYAKLTESAGQFIISADDGNQETNSCLRFKVKGTERMRLTPDGLTFNGDTAAANALDDYEEGTWTPTCTAFTISSIPSAKYIRIGRLVYLQAYIEITNNSGNSNGVVIAGLPFNVSNSGWSTGAVNMSDGNSTVSNLHVRAYSSSGDVNVKKNNDTIVLGTEIDAGHFIFSLTYKV